MQPLEIDSAVFCDGARYTIISRENYSILTCPVASGAGGYTLNRVEVRAYCKDAAEKRDPCLISAMAQASAAKSATAEGEAGGKKL